MSDAPVVAIDGPAGSGKSTVARGVAGALGAAYLDTGAMYRAVTWLALSRGLADADDTTLEQLAATADLHCTTDPHRPAVRIDGHDVTAAVRTAEVTAAVSRVSAAPGVRRVLVAEQRRLAGDAATGVVVEGRDIGTVVLPDAPVKVYLTASVAARATRRAAESAADVAATEAALARRDAYDSSRASGPLAPAPDAHLLDTTDMDAATAIRAVLDLCARVWPQPGSR